MSTVAIFRHSSIIDCKYSLRSIREMSVVHLHTEISRSKLRTNTKVSLVVCVLCNNHDSINFYFLSIFHERFYPRQLRKMCHNICNVYLHPRRHLTKNNEKILRAHIAKVCVLRVYREMKNKRELLAEQCLCNSCESVLSYPIPGFWFPRFLRMVLLKIHHALDIRWRRRNGFAEWNEGKRTSTPAEIAKDRGNCDETAVSFLGHRQIISPRSSEERTRYGYF